MLRNYITIAYRNLLRHKLFSFVNITGLAIGMAACLFILQYVTYELSYDDFHDKGKDIYRVSFQSYKNEISENRSAKSYPAVGSVIKNDFPEVKEFSRLVILGEAILTYNQAAIRETQIYLADSSIFNLCSFPLVKGHAATALAQPFTVLISRAVANKIFGEANPMDQTIQLHSNNLDGTTPFIVKGVFEDIPHHSHLKPQILISYPTLHEFIGRDIDQSWKWNNVYTYVLLHPEADVKAVNKKLSVIATRYNGKALQETGSRWEFFLQPLQSIHLYSDLLHEPEVNGNARSVYFLLTVAVFILIIAMVNFINLSTAKSIKRAKEVGIRKVSGAFRRQLIFQFITESLLLNLLGIIIAITLVQAFTSRFNLLAGIPAGYSLWDEPGFLLFLLVLLLVSAIASSIYPAFVLSAYQPVQVLKGNLRYELKDVWLRKGLVVGQFAISIMLIAGTLAAYHQLAYMQSGNLGIDISQTLVIQAPKAPDANGKNWDILKNELQKNPAVQAVAATEEIPGKEIYWRDSDISLPNQKPTATFTGALVDNHYFELLKASTKAGRLFDAAIDTREKSVVINEQAAWVLGFIKPEDAVSQKINIRNKLVEVIGVVEDFHQQSLKNAVEPMVFRYASDGYGFHYYLIRSNRPGKALISQVQTSFEQVFPANPFDYFFLDEYYNSQYKAEEQFGEVFGLFSGLAIFVACLGLFGLVSYATAQRTKEIGVRKVLGASVLNILTLLNKDFIKLLLLSNLIAWPLTYWGVSQWLENYAYKMEMSAWLYLTPTILVLIIALLTISIHTWKAARANPVHSLRYE